MPALKNINIFPIFQDRNFNLALANNYLFWTTEPWTVMKGHAEIHKPLILLYPHLENLYNLCGLITAFVGHQNILR